MEKVRNTEAVTLHDTHDFNDVSGACQRCGTRVSDVHSERSSPRCRELVEVVQDRLIK